MGLTTRHTTLLLAVLGFGASLNLLAQLPGYDVYEEHWDDVFFNGPKSYPFWWGDLDRRNIGPGPTTCVDAIAHEPIDGVAELRGSAAAFHTVELATTLLPGTRYRISYEISIRRRDALRQDINPQYKSLCSHSNPITELLFRDDLPDKVKDLSETSKLVNQLGSPGRQNSVRGRGGVRGRGFRGRGRGLYFLETDYEAGHLGNRFSPYPMRIKNQQGHKGSPLRGRRPRRM